MSHETGVLATFDGLYAAACEARDADAMVGLFVSDDDLSWWGSGESEQFVGPDKLRVFADEITRFEGSLRFVWHQRQVRIEGDTAWVNALGQLEVETAASRRTAPYRVTTVMLRRGSRWLWHTYHGSEPVVE